MNKKFAAYLLLIPFALFVAWNGYMMTTVQKSKTVKLTITGYDPRNLLSGRYIEFRVNWDDSDCTQFENNQCPMVDFKDVTRFYIPETKANQLDKIMAMGQQKVEGLFAYTPGRRPILTDVLIDHKPWQESVQ